MTISRRAWLAGAARLAAARAVAFQAPAADDALPASSAFAIPAGQTYLNSAFIHPIPIAAANAVTRYIESRSFSRERWSGDDLAAKVRAQFASLINAKAGEISLVESTSRGENLVVNGLGLPSSLAAGNVVTDALHFEGSLIPYGELQKRVLDVRLAWPRACRVETADMETAVNTKK